MKMVDDVHTLWKRWSTRIAASQAGLVLFWIGLPAEWKAAIPSIALAGVVGLLAFAFISAQSISQPKLRKDDDQPSEKDKP